MHRFFIVTATIAAALPLSLAAAPSGAVAAQVPPPTRLAASTDFFGARLGMTRAELMAHTPATAISGVRCTTAPSGDPKLLFLECGLHKLTVNFTAAGRVWQLRASYDFTETLLRTEDARAALVARYGKPSGIDPAGGLTWLAPGTPAARADLCAGSAMLLSAAIEQRDRPETAHGPLPKIDSGCAPVRTAILAKFAGHRGVIVDMQDARPRLAELARGADKTVSERR